MSCGVEHRCDSDLTLLWLWYRPVATAQFRPLAWEPPCATVSQTKKKKDKKKKEKELGVPIRVQWKWIWLGTMRLCFRSLASLSGLRIWHCCELWYRSQTWLGSRIAVTVVLGLQCSSDLTPNLGTSICCGCGSKKTRQKKKKKKRTWCEHWFSQNFSEALCLTDR